MGLTQKHCAPCRKDQAPYTLVEAQRHLPALDCWELADEGKWLTKTYRFKDFVTALDFVNRVAAIAEREGHHPDITFTWGRCILRLQTHHIGGLHENDFILAAHIDSMTAR